MIVLKSSDGETFEVEKSVALESLTIRDMIEDNCAETFEVEESVALESQIIKHEDNCANTIIPIPNVTSKILAKVIEYCKRHVEAPKSSDADNKSSGDDLKAFDADFVKVDQETLFDLILAANYLNIKTLLDLTCQTVADMIKGKNVYELHKFFNLKYECTPEELEEVRRENAWAFE